MSTAGSDKEASTDVKRKSKPQTATPPGPEKQADSCVKRLQTSVPAGIEKNQLQGGPVPASYQLLVGYEDGWHTEKGERGGGCTPT